MDSLLVPGQLIYTSFAGIGFKTLASGQVPTDIQQAFIELVAFRHWDASNPPSSGYRAVYLHQVTPKHTLFGWLYEDGVDDRSRRHVPYFICYYLMQPVSAFQLENIFTWLHNGPVAMIDRHSPPATLETIVVADLWSYQPVRPGVAIPSVVRKRSHIALQQGELLDLFVPVDQQEMVSEVKEQTYSQQKANLSVYGHQVVGYIVEGIETAAAAPNENAAITETEVIKPPAITPNKTSKALYGGGTTGETIRLLIYIVLAGYLISS